MIRKAARIVVSIVLFLVACLASVLLVAAVGNRVHARYVRRHVGWRMVFQAPLKAGAEIPLSAVTWRRFLADTPEPIHWTRTDCVIGRRVAADVAAGDLVMPSLVEGASACIQVERPDERTQD